MDPPADVERDAEKGEEPGELPVEQREPREADGADEVEIEGEKKRKRPGCAARLKSVEQCLDRLPFPPGVPPLRCVRQPGCCQRTWEANRSCRRCGRLGFGIFGNFRKLLLFVSLTLSTVSALLRGLPAAALSTDRGTLSQWPWAYGDYICLQQDKCNGLEAKIYIGLESLLVDSRSFNIYKAIPWAADDCVENLESLGAGSYCAVCRDASRGCAAMAFLSIACSLFNIWADLQRMRARNDHNCIKTVAIVSNILGALQLLLAVSIFQGLCVAEFPLEDADQTFRIDLVMGRGGALIASACSINVFNLVVHWLIPVPEARWNPNADAEDDPAADLWQQKSMSSVMPEGRPGAVKRGWTDDPAKLLVPIHKPEKKEEVKEEPRLSVNSVPPT
ncbi:unnamed protein product [Durusdinium trenchii]|uniref:Transmembrane protein n=1 Tax=Durusdinium trenchii TaxID=1381693 RepID=A0ABP0MWD7_9DINO